MKKRFFSLAGALILGTFVAGANAASVSLTATSPTSNLAEGAVVGFVINIDFTADGGTVGGGFDVTYDASQLALLAVFDAGLGDPFFGRLPDESPGLLSSWAVGDFNGIQSGELGSVLFTVLAGATSSSVSLGPTAGIAGPWISLVDLVSVINPQYNQIAVTAVPLPAAAWLFGTALAGLVGAGRMKKKAA